VFDLVAGTSTGGILTLGLTRPGQGGKAQYSAETLIELYETEGEKIFDRNVWHKLHSVGGLAEEKYPSKDIDEAATRYFGDVYLAEALTEVLVTAYEIKHRGPWFFKRRHARAQDKKGDNFLMRKVARATSAAPTYFEPLPLEWGPHGQRAFIDGGVHSNNPAMCAYVEARKFYPEENDFLVVSLGTGVPSRHHSSG
jgi:patatin-like phospholipase/acyl hydrolase